MTEVVAVTPVARWARLELELWSFAFFGWFQGPRVAAGTPAFSHHRESGWSAIALALALLVLVEGAIVHLWLESAGLTLLKWIALVVHVYGLIWLLGDLQALRLRRSTLGGGAEPHLELRVGVRARGRFALASIAEVRSGSWDEAGPGELLVRLVGPANLKIVFRHEVELTTALRARTPLRVLLLQVDEPALLERALAEGMSS